MRRLAIIDIGSNSFRLLLTEINDEGCFKVLDVLKESVRLGANMINDVYINEDRINKAVDTLKTFKSLCDALQINEIRAVATEAVRKSENKSDFISKVKEATGIDIHILTGEEEVYYDYLGVTNSMYVNNSLIVDMGGSSTELAWIYNNKLMKSAILPIGAVNLTQKFNLEDLVNPINEEKLKTFLIDEYSSIPWLFDVRFDSIIGIGGTVRNIGKIDRINKRYTLDLHHNYEMNESDVHNIYNIVKSKNLKQRRNVEGLSKDRADIFVGPTCAIYLLMNMLNIEKLIVSGKGVREGILFDYIIKKNSNIEDILDYSIKNVISKHNVNEYHANNVFKLTTILFNKLKSLHHLDDTYSKIIKTASMLHDCGLSVRFYDHHKHSFYIILNSELYGLNHKELIMSALTASYHEDTIRGHNIFQFHGIINRMDITITEKIGVLLRIAECLDKSMSGKVNDIVCAITDELVTIKVISDEDTTLEKSYAQKCSDIFHEIYEKELIIL